jgi:hypothetical protein
MHNFSFLKKSLNKLIFKINEIYKLIVFSNLRPTIYFSTSLKEQLKYIFGKNKEISYKPQRS